MLAEAAESDVVLLGECHDDPIAHSLEAFVLISLAARRDKCGLSLDPSRRAIHIWQLMSIHETLSWQVRTLPRDV